MLSKFVVIVLQKESFLVYNSFGSTPAGIKYSKWVNTVT